MLSQNEIRYPGFKTFLALRKFVTSTKASEPEKPNGSSGNNSAGTFASSYQSKRRESTGARLFLTERQFNEIKKRMMPDLRQKIRDIADLKVIIMFSFIQL